jgi:DNA-binding MarR family transcriptional regulator
MRATGDRCARELLDTIPLIMRFIRSQMRSRRIAGLSVTQFRVLLFISRCRESSLSAVAEHVGVSLPSVSRMADNLATRGLLVRQTRSDDRRGICLSTTARGEKTLNAARKATQAELERRIASLGEEQRGMILQTMQVLGPIFANHFAPKTQPSR